jgi:preprotein translocase subunit SecD
VSELFGETEDSEASSDSAVVDENIFAERPFSAMLRNLGQTIGVPEKNVYAVKKILERPEVQEKLATVGGKFLFSHKAEEYPLVDGTLETMYSLFLVEDAAELTGGVVEEAKANLGPQGSTSAGQPIVNLTMNSDGARKWSIVTGSNVGRQVALVLDKKVHMAPNIREKISGGSTLIEGFADINEAKDIAIVLRAGALPAPVDIIQEKVIGPSLGADSVRSGTLSVIIGLGLVLVFMLIYYRFAGLIADFALIWNIVLVLAVLASLQATLTLPGIAGLILTVGMSIDANVIIFERIREELRKGKTPKAAVSSGYDRALTTIIDANMTTAIAALVLWQFGTGPIKGFATVLFWGILISMFTAIFVTRTIFNSFTSRKGFTKLSI